MRRQGGRNTMSMVALVARLYHEQGMTQPAIAEQLRLSQPRVSRWLKQAAEEGIVRTVVIPPDGVFPVLEDRLVQRYGLRQALVVDVAGDERTIMQGLGGAAAVYMEATLESRARVGFSSWSGTLLAMVDAMQPLKHRRAEVIVQIMGGVGNPEAQVQATQLTHLLARLTGAEPVFLPTPGIVVSAATRDALFEDPNVQAAAKEWSTLTDLLVGIGSVAPSPFLQVSGNAVSEAEMAALAEAGAVGDVAMRFFDAEGQVVQAEIDGRVIGIAADQMLAVPRRVGVAGGERKVEAIRGALKGGWIDVLITDHATARALTADGG